MHKRIAILCMSMNIGGAETHILELAKQLKKNGNEITVYSNGGVYVEQLESFGIRHVKAPLHANTLSNLIRSYRIILKDFKKNRPSVVHSHTRISNYVAGQVCKRLSIPMVTTVHGHFYSDFFSRLVANWGCRALAVSEDLKEYLVTNYNYDPQRVILTVNGIDSERFSKADRLEAKNALSLSDREKTILFVSRLDQDTSAHIFKFLKLAPIIHEQHPEVKILIVGNGEDFEKISDEAAIINKQCGNDFIRMEGARTNIEQYTAASDLFIGVSRAALEAMAAGIPTILMGQFGYLGLYSDAIKDSAIKTNLTCRRCPYPSDQEIIQLVDHCLTKDLSKEISDGKKLVEEHYSLSKMADTAMEQYQAAIHDFRPYDYMISGYYGCENFGDDLTLGCLMEHLEGKSGTVLTCNKAQTLLPKNVEMIHRFSMREINKRMKQTKVMLLGSGSILQDATSFRSFFYYYVIMRMAIHNRCKTMLFANGIGPIIRKSNLLRLKKLIKHIDCITLRDEDSSKFLNDLGLNNHIFLAADDSFSICKENIKAASHYDVEPSKKIVGVNLKIPHETPDTQISSLADGLFYLAQKYNLYYLFIPFHFEQDYPSLSRLSAMLPNTSLLIKEIQNPKEIMSYIASADYQIFERLHGQILSTILEIPFLPISYDLKISSFAHQVGIENYLLEHQNLCKETLVAAFEKIIEEQDIMQKKLISYNDKAKKMVKINKEKLIQLIEEY